MSRERGKRAGRGIFMLVFYTSSICDVAAARRRSCLRRQTCSSRNTNDLSLFFFWLPQAGGMWDPGSPTGDRTCASFRASVGS